MAKQKSQDKPKAILEAAIAVFAERGFWNTPTSLISKTAGVADGTLFNYFETKDELINAVYLEIKRELAGELLAGLPANGTVQDKMRHIWNHYIEWGVQYPDKLKVLHQISESFSLDDEVKSQGNEPFAEIEQMARESVKKGEFRDYPVEYLGALMDNQAVMTVRFIMMSQDKEADYQKIGFDILWNGIIR
jgi:AcrR family transcriptional regulator